VERRIAIAVLGFQFRASFEERPGDFGVVCVVEGRVSVIVADVHIGAVFHEESDLFCALGGEEEGLAAFVSGIRGGGEVHGGGHGVCGFYEGRFHFGLLGLRFFAAFALTNLAIVFDVF
jgi:hypothetical protein